jgi:hypothetical protein
MALSANKISAGDTGRIDNINDIIDDLEDLEDRKVELTGDETIAGKKTFSTIPETSGGNPTTDNQLSRKAYTDTKYKEIGSSASKNWATNYEATEDGFLTAWIHIGTSTTSNQETVVDVYSDNTSTPTTIIARSAANLFSSGSSPYPTTICRATTITVPIKKGNYYRVDKSRTPASLTSGIYFTPIKP